MKITKHDTHYCIQLEGKISLVIKDTPEEEVVIQVASEAASHASTSSVSGSDDGIRLDSLQELMGMVKRKLDKPSDT